MHTLSFCTLVHKTYAPGVVAPYISRVDRPFSFFSGFRFLSVKSFFRRSRGNSLHMSALIMIGKGRTSFSDWGIHSNEIVIGVYLSPLYAQILIKDELVAFN